MLKIFNHTINQGTKSKWMYYYSLFYALLGLTTLFLRPDSTKALASLVSVVLILSPLTGTVFGVVHYYGQLEFTKILLALPLSRGIIVLGQYLGLAVCLATSFAIGLTVPFLFYGIPKGLPVLIALGSALHFIFTALAYLISLINSDSIRGFGFAILMWLLFAVVYDGVFLSLLVSFSHYPLEEFTVGMSLLNPIDLARTTMLMSINKVGMMGYTGAVFNRFFTHSQGGIIALIALLSWITLPLLYIQYKLRTKDF